MLYNILKNRVKGAQQGLLEPQVLLLQAVSLLQALSTKEAIVGLSSEELAGFVAGTLEIDTVVRIRQGKGEPIFALGGMGGDRGIPLDGEDSKLFSISTLAALGLG